MQEPGRLLQVSGLLSKSSKSRLEEAAEEGGHFFLPNYFAFLIHGSFIFILVNLRMFLVSFDGAVMRPVFSLVQIQPTHGFGKKTLVRLHDLSLGSFGQN